MLPVGHTDAQRHRQLSGAVQLLLLGSLPAVRSHTDAQLTQPPAAQQIQTTPYTACTADADKALRSLLAVTLPDGGDWHL